MRVLQVSSDYSRQKIYSDLFSKLQWLGLEQEIFVPVRSKEEIGRYNISELPNTSINYAYILRKYHRILFKSKINSTLRNLVKTVEIRDIDLSHAHFLFSNGAVVLRLKSEFNIPYVVTVRNTDVNVFFKYMRHLRQLGLKILIEAEQIIFLTPAYVDEVMEKYIPDNLKVEFKKKVSIVPNGLDDFWLKNKVISAKMACDMINLLYVGDFTYNKNVLSIIKAARELKNDNINISITIVGGGGNGERSVIKEIKNDSNLSITYVGRVEEKEKLLSFYRNCDIFIMPSFKETFGIVYLEAMSQGMPILYTRGQGVDGYFNCDGPGYALDPYCVTDIKEKILKAHTNLPLLSRNALKWIDTFSWDNSANKHKLIYETAINRFSKF